MKNIVIGDIHGKRTWKDFIDQDFDNLFFVGDYFDCFEDIPTVSQVRNFKEICTVARNNPKIKLCIGNHDLQYISGNKNHRCSGFQYYGQFDIKEVLKDNIDLLELIHIIDDKIISHGGVSNTWLNHNSITLDEVNDRFMENMNICDFNGMNQYGDNVTQSPVWIRPNSLMSDLVPGYKQIVGHTHFDKITTIDDVTFVDCFDTTKEVYYFE